MARFGAWRPLSSNWGRQAKMVRHDLVILHTMAGSLGGTESHFKKQGYSGTFSHFGIGPNGETYQWQDTDFRSAANGAANPRSVTVETADYGPGFPKWNLNDASQIPAWTPAQVETLVNLIVWACRTHNIPCVLVPDSKPGRRGIAWHRLGVVGYAVRGGEIWSSARGKVCPGNRRIAQIPGIVAEAARRLGNKPPAGVPASTAKPSSGQYPSLSEGDTGDLVARVQAWMKPRFSYARDIDLGPRRYGPATVQMIKTFQQRVGITGADANGTVIGPRTWAELIKLGFK